MSPDTTPRMYSLKQEQANRTRCIIATATNIIQGIELACKWFIPFVAYRAWGKVHHSMLHSHMHYPCTCPHRLQATILVRPLSVCSDGRHTITRRGSCLTVLCPSVPHWRASQILFICVLRSGFELGQSKSKPSPPNDLLHLQHCCLCVIAARASLLSLQHRAAHRTCCYCSILQNQHHCFGVSVSVCFDVSSHAATAPKSAGLVSFSFVSTSRLCNRATNFERSEPLKVKDLPSCFISFCDS